MIRAPKSCAFAVLAILLLTASKEPLPPYMPEDTAPGAPPREGESWIFSTESAATRLTRLTDEERLAYIEAVTGFRIDPFAASPDHSKMYVTFRFDLENRSSGVLIFQPQNCRIFSPGQDGWRGPYDMPAIVSAFHLFEHEMPPAFMNVQKALFDGQVMLNPGEKRSGLLVFPAVESHWSSFRVEVGWTTVDARHVGFEAPYRRVKKKK